MAARRSNGIRRAVSVWLSQHLQSAVGSAGTLSRAPLGTSLTASVIGVALALPFSLYLVLASASEVLGRFDPGGEISAFLRPGADDAAARALADRLADRADVAAARVITRDEALAEFRDAVGVSGLAESLGGNNPLPPVVVLRPAAADEPALVALTGALEGLPEIEFVQVDRRWLRRLSAMLDLARRGLWLVAGLLCAGVVLVVGNTLRMSIEARRAEIEVAKLFGASDAFVRRPFLYHGALYGLAGAVVACLLVAVSRLVLEGPLERLGALYAGSLTLAGPRPVHFLALLAAGGGLGLLAAWASVGRHLRAIEPR